VLVAVVAFGLVFAALDVREAIHQASQSNLMTSSGASRN